MAGRKCSVCLHAERDAIEAALQSGGSLLGVARSMGLTREALRRHMAAHIGRPTPAPANPKRQRQHAARRAKTVYLAGALSATPSMEAMEAVTPPAPELPEPPEVPLGPWVRLPAPDVLARADREPLTIPNAYRQLEQLNGLLYEIIQAEEPKGKDGGQAPEWVMVADRQYRLGAMRELRATISATLKLWEAQKAIEERYSGNRPLKASEVVSFLRRRYPDALAGLLEHLRMLRVDTEV